MTVEDINNRNQNIHSANGSGTYADFGKPASETTKKVAELFFMIGGITFLATPLTFISGLIALQGFALASSLAIVSVACISLGIPLAAFTIVALAIAAGKVLNSTESPVIKDDNQQDVSIESSHPNYIGATAPTLEALTGT